MILFIFGFIVGSLVGGIVSTWVMLWLVERAVGSGETPYEGG